MLDSIHQFAFQAQNYLTQLAYDSKDRLTDLLHSSREKILAQLPEYCDKNCVECIREWSNYTIDGAIIGGGIAFAVGIIYNSQVRKVRSNLVQKNSMTQLFLGKKEEKTTPLDFNALNMAMQGIFAGTLVGSVLFLKNMITEYA